MDKQAVGIFDGAAVIDMPESMEPCNLDEVRERLSFLESGSSMPGISPVTDRLERVHVQWSHDTFLTDNSDSTLSCSGYVTESSWQDNALEERLNLYHQVLARSLPLYTNAGLASRELDGGSGNLHTGLIRLTYATVDKNWLGYLMLVPIRGMEAVFFMNCSYDDAAAGALKFERISESIQLGDL